MIAPSLPVPEIEAWAREVGVEAYALVDADGRTIAGRLSETVPLELFGVMCATMFGAASAAGATLGDDTPVSLSVSFAGGELTVAPLGTRTLLCAMLPPSVSPTLLVDFAARLGAVTARA